MGRSVLATLRWQEPRTRRRMRLLNRIARVRHSTSSPSRLYRLGLAGKENTGSEPPRRWWAYWDVWAVPSAKGEPGKWSIRKWERVGCAERAATMVRPLRKEQK